MHKNGSTLNNDAIESLFSVIHTSLELFKRAQYFGTDTLLHFSEIHLIEAIGCHDKTHLAAFANLLGVTKGAISQTAMKLEKKGFIRKIVDPANRSRYFLELTAKGTVGFRHHQEFHHSIQGIVHDVLSNLSPGEQRIVQDFLVTLAAELVEV